MCAFHLACIIKLKAFVFNGQSFSDMDFVFIFVDDTLIASESFEQSLIINPCQVSVVVLIPCFSRPQPVASWLDTCC
jgi:hypothetical protein